MVGGDKVPTKIIHHNLMYDDRGFQTYSLLEQFNNKNNTVTTSHEYYKSPYTNMLDLANQSSESVSINKPNMSSRNSDLRLI